MDTKEGNHLAVMFTGVGASFFSLTLNNVVPLPPRPRDICTLMSKSSTVASLSMLILATSLLERTNVVLCTTTPPGWWGTQVSPPP